MSDRVFTLLAAQVRPVAYDPEATFVAFERVVRTASAFRGVELIVFPELYLTGEDPFSREAPFGFLAKVAEEIPGELTERIGKVAERGGVHIAAGSMLERSGDDIFNTAVFFSPDGRLVATHRKVFPWRPWEATAKGDRADAFDVPGIGRLGMMVCYDGWFPEVPRALALDGAELIVHPTLTTTADREQELILARANAIANQAFVINVNAATTVGGGRSIGVDPEGRVLFEAGTGEELITEVIDLDRAREVRERGTRGLNPLLREVREASPGFLESSTLRLRGRTAEPVEEPTSSHVREADPD
jgi:formamidase